MAIILLQKELFATEFEHLTDVPADLETKPIATASLFDQSVDLMLVMPEFEFI